MIKAAALAMAKVSFSFFVFSFFFSFFFSFLRSARRSSYPSPFSRDLLHKVPAVNSSWMGTFIREHKHADICVAVSTPTGLITPIVSRAEQRGERTPGMYA